MPQGLAASGLTGGAEAGVAWIVPDAPERSLKWPLIAVKVATARYITEYNGQKVYFCSAGCKRAFEKEPERYHRVEA
ncbi:MAG: hypothetical protein C4309_09035 [Chloroflexota bacterium]